MSVLKELLYCWTSWHSYCKVLNDEIKNYEVSVKVHYILVFGLIMLISFYSLE
jgi:hypothetical protein